MKGEKEKKLDASSFTVNCERLLYMKSMNRAIFREGHLQPDAAPGIILRDHPTGKHALGLDIKRDGWLYVPQGYNAAKPLPFVLLLHGAGGIADHGMNLLQAYADKYHLILLAPTSRKGTWDLLLENQFGLDLIFLNTGLSHTFRSYSIDPKHLAIGGFSDGASYALCLGLMNGGLFTHIIAFSPGFAYAPAPQSRPDIYISHGVHDRILPIERCGRKVATRLRNQGYNVNFQAFDDEHVIPDNIREEAVKWFLYS
jgi:phospholipase/carboxylesterase